MTTKKTDVGKNVETDPLAQHERERSNFVRDLVQNPKNSNYSEGETQMSTPRKIVQFWDNLTRLPDDVKECMDSWKPLEQVGFSLEVFDEADARSFIEKNLGRRYAAAFDKCYHPSMKSDYFRYSYIFVEGGFYIDADDVYHGKSIEPYFIDGRLKLQPFCYDMDTSKMVEPSQFLPPEAYKLSWIFYFNTTPLIAPPNHPIVERVLLNATNALEQEIAGTLPEVQATTGPGILTQSVTEIFRETNDPKELFFVARDWENVSTSRWHLSYRNDSRNWRLSNQKGFTTQFSGKEK